MKIRDLSVKRKPLKKGLLYTLQAKLGGKIKRPAATAVADPAELDGDIPRMNVGRSLLVIALLHVFGIAGIFAQKYFENGGSGQEPSGQGPSSKPAAAAAVLNNDRPTNGATALTGMTSLPQIQRGDDRHMVLAGDTYQSIARKWNIGEESLRTANSNVNLCSGLVLRVPPREIVALEPEEMQRLRNGGQADGPSPRAILVRPNVNLDNAPRATPVIDDENSSGKTYTARKGDTFSKIARDHGTTVTLLMKTNGITNDRSLKIGQVLKIPSKQY
jgi:LysM repeat protein